MKKQVKKSIMDNAREYWIYADESVQAGAKYSKFFGGCIVPAHKCFEIKKRLESKKYELRLGKEMKWQRVTHQRLDDYQSMITAFFDELRAGHVRVRIMFQETKSTFSRAPEENRHDPYYKLYYQFIKHAFGLAHMPVNEQGTRLRLFLDQLPHTAEYSAQFKGFIAALPQSSQLRHQSLKLDPSHIAEVDSKSHVLLQCVDVVLGAMAFRLNEMHLVKPDGSRIRGKRTIAKDKLYRHILSEISSLKPHFNPKISTASDPFPEGTWSMPYRHWLFKTRGL
ncbi:MAG: DUF3800 domain-containing protein [Verrucomicrobia bacterium]|nr:DUF3800 domain-containing protein [Verrucomicrobiota bacterium]MCH8513313.1 DUF3800 domain-containing protein [Kiritimatiellia bacterium]